MDPVEKPNSSTRPITKNALSCLLFPLVIVMPQRHHIYYFF